MKDKRKMGEMMGELEQPKFVPPTLGQRLHQLAATKAFKYTTRGILIAAAFFLAVKYAPSAVSDIGGWINNQKVSSYENRFAQVKNYVLLEDYASADSLITTLESEMKDEAFPEMNSLLETIVAYDKQEIDPILQRTATQQAVHLSQTQTEQAIIVIEQPTQTPSSAPSWGPGNASSKTLEQVVLLPGQTLYVSSTQFKIGDIECSMQDKTLCVYFKQTAATETVTVENLVPGESWLQVANAISIESAIARKSQDWWVYPNCGNGCLYADVTQERVDELGNRSFQRGIIAKPDLTVSPTSTSEIPASPYDIISLQSYSVFSILTTSLSLPLGNQTLLGIPFEIGWDLKTPCTNNTGDPAIYSIDTNLDDISKLHFLIQGGWMSTGTAGKEIGEITLSFTGGTSYSVPLIPGSNIRDWSIGKSNTVTTVTDSQVQEAWTGHDTNGDGRMDILTLNIPPSFRGLTLTNITIEDASYSNLGSVNPCIYVNGITAEKGQ